VSYTIAMVDDDRQVHDLFTALLTAEDYVVETFERGEDLLGWMETNEPAVCLSDFQLPDMDGLEVLEQVRKLRPTCQRILITGHPDLQSFQTALNSGTIQYFLGKPWDNDEAITTIDGAVARYIQQGRHDAMAALMQRQNEELDTMTRQLESMVDRRTRQIERAKREWERTFDAINSPLTQVNSRFEVLRANLATAAQAGRHVRELPGSKCYESIFGRTEPCLGCPLKDAQDEIMEYGSAEAEIADVAKDKGFLLSVYQFDTDVDNLRYVCYYKDITEEKKLQLQVVQSEKMAGIGQLAGGVAHELNNPIGVILSFTQFSMETAQDIGDEELIDNLQEIEAAAQRCKGIVGGMLEFSRPSVDEQMGLVDLVEMVEKALFLVSTQRASRNVEIVKELAEDLPPVIGNNNQLLQVFINLIRNAIQAMSGGGTLRLLAATDERQQIRVSVVDSGPGIPTDKLNRIFEPFYTTKAPGEGTGLGLSVSYGIIERHRGLIEVASTKGEGATFTVVLPPAPSGD
jgi:two-component system, NtrC family, sensor kinase